MNAEISNNIKQQLPKNIEQYMGYKHDIYKRSFKEEEKIWHQIPLLNYIPLHKLHEESIVRFRGMIQDMQDPEMYLEHYEVQDISGKKVRVQEGKYRDCLVLNKDETVNYDAECNVHGERRVFHVISIPALNDWCIEYEKNINDKILMQFIDVDDAKSSMEENASTNGNAKDKANANAPENACEKMVSMDLIKSDASKDYLLNFPIAERPGMACLIKIYEDFDIYCLNDLIDVIGFLSMNVHLDGSHMITEFDNAAEVQAKNPPPNLIPRLHVIAIKKLSHSNPLIYKYLQQPTLNNSNSTHFTDETNYTELHTFLKLCCFNDPVAADYLLCHLISNVYSRRNQHSIGKLSLNLWNFPREIYKLYTKDFYDLLSLLMPASHYVALTLDTVNTMAFTPKKDYETNKLVSGLLQLAPQSHLIFDETCMEQGKLETQGIQNLRHLAYLLKYQQMRCNFEYYDLDYDVDIPILIYSEGRSMLPCDISLPLIAETKSLKIMPEIMKASHHYLMQNNRLYRFRCYLSQCKLMTFSMAPTDSEIVEHDFVEMRKKNSLMNGGDLHNLLVLARLLAISRGKRTFDKDSWNLAKDMEFKRNQRLSGLPGGSRNNPIVF